MATFAEQLDRLDTATSGLASELAGLRDDLASQDSEFASRLDGPIARLEAMGKDEDDVAADNAAPADENPASSEDASA